MIVKTPADVLRAADEQMARAKRILNGDLPPPNELVTRAVREYGRIVHDMEIIEMRVQKAEKLLAGLRTTYARLQGAADNVERNVAAMEWYGDVEQQGGNQAPAPSEVKAEGAA